MNNKLTKIVATLGPASDSEETIAQLIEAGVNIFRFNTKHGTTDWHQERIQRVQKVADTLKVNIGILLDLQGPEIRLETFDKQKMQVEKGQLIRFTPSFVAGSDTVCIPHQLVFDTLKTGDQLLIDDGSLELIVETVTSDLITARPTDNGVIGHRKGVNIPGAKLALESLIEADIRQLDMASMNKVDFVGLSFSRTKKDIEILRNELVKRNINALVVAKIENGEALENIDEVIEATDVVMVARGDLGVEVPIEQIAFWQKTIITKCRVANKPVITATQMLESMTNNPRPTRAEATDVANAIFDGTDAIMLSGETANGLYPVKTVQTMARIAKFNEQVNKLIDFDVVPKDGTDIMVKSVKEMLNQDLIDIKMVLVFTSSGKTARSISKLRPKVSILAATTSQKVVEELTISYGVETVIDGTEENNFTLPNKVTEDLLTSGRLQRGDTILVVHGQHYYKEGSTNSVALFKL